MSTPKYDYIISGGGCAGLSLAYQIAQLPALAAKRILIIERDEKTANDRTWCFWEKEPGPFESILHHEWKNAMFYGKGWSKLLNLKPYTYKMIHADRFYQFVKDELARHPQIEWMQTDVLGMYTHQNQAVVETSAGHFHADYIFNSIPSKPKPKPGHHYLQQHFKGWRIETEKPAFDPFKPTLMDFTIPQMDECRFMYVLPTSPTEALVEFTLFSENLLEDQAYDAQIASYIQEKLHIDSYQIKQTEFGVIPMFSEPFEQKPSERVVNIGSAGGMTKASTGYTFTRIQRQSQWMAAALEADGSPHQIRQGWSNRFALYDNVLLHVLSKNIVSGARIFLNLFRYNKPAAVFRFLDEETHFLQEYRILNTVPILKFIGPGWKELLRLKK